MFNNPMGAGGENIETQFREELVDIRKHSEG